MKTCGAGFIDLTIEKARTKSGSFDLTIERAIKNNG